MKKCKRTLSLLCAIVLIVTLVAPTAMALRGPDVSVPQDYELIYFADCGANAFPANIQSLLEEHRDTVKNAHTPDQAYDGTTWGYNHAPDNMDDYQLSDDLYETFRCFAETVNGQTMQYKFAVDAGQYKVTVGVYDPWTTGRQAAISVNGGTPKNYSYNSGAGFVTLDATVDDSENGELTVNLAPVGGDGSKNYDVMVSFIMVTKKVEEPQPEQPEMPSVVWGKNGADYALVINYQCTNEDAAHKGGNSGTDKKNFISNKNTQYFTFGDMTLNDGVWELPATFNAALYLEEKFGEPHTAADVEVTLEYISSSKKWCVQAEGDVAELNLTGTCGVSGPADPELGTNLTVWVQLYEGIYDPVGGSQIDRNPSTYTPCLTFGNPYKDGETWECEMTVLGYSADGEIAAHCPVNQMMPEGYELDPSQGAEQTVTLTYNQGKAQWECPELPREYTSNGPGDTFSQTQYGVAFLIRPVTQEPAPDGPSKDNCTDFNVTVYGKEPRTEHMFYSSLSSYIWHMVPSKYQVDVSFSKPTPNGEGQWVCTATVDATVYVEKVAQEKASSNFFPMGDSTIKTVELTYNESNGKWVAAPDGITYGYPSSPSTKKGVAFGLEKRYTVTFAPGSDLKFQTPTGEAPESIICAPGGTVQLPQTTDFVTENGIFAGWKAIVGSGSSQKVYFYPLGTETMTMFNDNVTLEAYWMDVELEAATVPYDDSLTVKEYTFAPEVYLTPEGNSVTVLYRAKVLGNGNQPYVLTCEGAQAVYNTQFSGTIDFGKTSEYVYFTVTYTADELEAMTEETVAMGNASGSVPVVHAPDLPVPGETVLFFADGDWVEVTYACTNENAVHKPANTKTFSKQSFNRQYLKAVGTLERNANRQFTCQVTLDTAALLSDASGFGVAHTGEDVVLTAVYNQAKGRWELPAEPVEVTGSCTQNGPEGPNGDNCDDFYVTVYGYEPNVDDSVDYSSLRSTVWDILRDNFGVPINFTEPQKNDEGVWTCQATIEAESWVQEMYEYYASSNYRRDDTDPTTKTITLTYNQGKGKWVAELDGIDYPASSKPNPRYGVAFRLVKQYTVTFVPGRDLAGHIPQGQEVFGGAYDKGAVVELPQTTNFVTENGVFAGWAVTVKEHDYDPNVQYLFYPVGTKTMTMPGKNVEVEAMWMDVELEVADLPYDENKGVGDYTFGNAANFVIDGDTITVLYRADVRGNSRYPYALTVYGPEATAVYGSELEGALGVPEVSRYVYFTVTYTAEEFEALTQQTVAMGNASDSVDVTVTVEHHAEGVAYVAPTCTEDGSKAYWHCTGCGKYFADETCTQEITEDIDTWKVISAAGHSYGEPEFQWSADGKTCTVTFTCGNDKTHVETLTAQVTSAVKTAPSCTEKGVTTYTAKLSFGGKDYTATLELTDIPAAGHHYEDGVCTVCGEKDPDYVEPTTEPTKPATDPDGPDQTGDTTPVALLMSLLLISAACLSVIIAKNRKVRF